MTVDEVFAGLSSHMLQGVMFHSQMMDYFDFLNLRGYKRMEEYHAKAEMKEYHKIHRYYINQYNKLLPEDEFENPNAIPAKWLEHTRQDVDISTKKQGVKNAFMSWVEWERATKILYQQYYKELLDLGEISAAIKIGRLIECVSEELKWARRKKLDLSAVDYAMEFVLDEQTYYHDFYKKKMKAC